MSESIRYYVDFYFRAINKEIVQQEIEDFALRAQQTMAGANSAALTESMTQIPTQGTAVGGQAMDTIALGGGKIPMGTTRINIGTGGMGGGIGGEGGASRWEQFEQGYTKMQLFSGGLSNLIHSYYWYEAALERTENAELRLLNAQEKYNEAVTRYGANSQQAISASRSLEIATNNLERAHLREFLNFALILNQMTYAIGRFATLTRGWWDEAIAIGANTTAVNVNSGARALHARISGTSMGEHMGTWSTTTGETFLGGGGAALSKGVAGGGLMGKIGAFAGSPLGAAGIIGAVLAIAVGATMWKEQAREEEQNVKYKAKYGSATPYVDMGDINVSVTSREEVARALNARNNDVMNELNRSMR